MNEQAVMNFRFRVKGKHSWFHDTVETNPEELKTTFENKGYEVELGDFGIGLKGGLLVAEIREEERKVSYHIERDPDAFNTDSPACTIFVPAGENVEGYICKSHPCEADVLFDWWEEAT